jgi:uncharacterized protein DUF1848
MIISASYRTDIPCFYGPWFLRRLEAGFCRTINPYGGQVVRVDLRPEAVDGIVFWTKNLGPFLPHLPEVQDHGYPFVVHYTINDYPRALEGAVVDSSRAVTHVKQLAATFGPRVVVWRYDPVVFTSRTPASFHRENFAALAEAMAGSVDEVVISFAHVYRKTRRHLEHAARREGFTWEDPADQVKCALARDLVAIARPHGLALTVCSQGRYVVEGAAEAACVDAARLSDVAGHAIRAPRKGNRPDCRCHLSRDVGAYDTCPHGCVYCYAVNDPARARQRFREHDPESEFLVEPVGWRGQTGDPGGLFPG